MSNILAAVDLGATSGRVMLGSVSHNELSVRPVARSHNGRLELLPRPDGGLLARLVLSRTTLAP